MPSCGVCLSVRLSVTFVYSDEMNQHIFKMFFTFGYSHNILVFPYQMLWQYSDADPLTGASNAGGVGKNCDSRPISGSIACCECERFGRQVQTRCCDGPWQVDDSGRWKAAAFVFHGRRRRSVYDKKPQRYV